MALAYAPKKKKKKKGTWHLIQVQRVSDARQKEPIGGDRNSDKMVPEWKRNGKKKKKKNYRDQKTNTIDS